MPTFLEVAGLDVPPDVQGRSLTSLFAEPDSDAWRKSIYYHYYEHGGEHQVPRHEGVRTERYKLINFYSNDGFDLYDLKKDPQEMRDVADDEEYAAVLTSLKSELQRLREQYDLPELSATARP